MTRRILSDAQYTMNSAGDNLDSVVRYDPLMTKIRHENEELRLDIDRRKAHERDLRKRLERAERRILEAGQMTTKMESMKKHNQKLEKQLRSLKKYLSELPTRDEYKTLQNEKCQLLDSSKFMENEMSTIKDKLKSYTVSVDQMSRDRSELAHELEQARQRINHLELNQTQSESQETSELVTQLRAQCTQIMIKLKDEKHERLEMQKSHQIEREQLAETVKLLQESQGKLTRQNERLTNECNQLTTQLDDCGGVESFDQLKDKLTTLIEIFEQLIDKAKRFQKSQKSEDIYYPDETYDDPLSDDLLLDLDETHKQVIKQNGQTTFADLELRLDKLTNHIAEMEAFEMANACQVQ